MKHIQKFNEAKNEAMSYSDRELFKTYIDSCFIDFYDDGICESFDDTEEETFCLSFKLPSKRESNRLERGWDSKNIESFKTSIGNLNDMTLKIEESILKVISKYENIEYCITLDTNENNTHNMYLSVYFYYGSNKIAM